MFSIFTSQIFDTDDIDRQWQTY